MKLKERERKVLIGILRDREYLVTDFLPRHRHGSDMLKRSRAVFGVFEDTLHRTPVGRVAKPRVRRVGGVAFNSLHTTP